MKFVVTVRFKLEEDKRDDFLRLLQANAEASMESEPGCLQFDICLAEGDATAVFLYEVYTSKAAFQAHLASEHFLRFEDEASAMVESKSVETFVRLDQ